MIDLHAHLPMQFDPEQRVRRAAKRRPERWIDRLRFAILEFADRYFNRANPDAGHAVTIETLCAGNVGVALSVAYCPFDELDVFEPYGSAPRDTYFKPLHDLLRVVERNVALDPRAVMVRNFAELRAARDAGKVAVIHAVEGGFHLGSTKRAIEHHLDQLAEMGTGYVTVAHLLYRAVATNSPALPFLPDAVYRFLFSQPVKGLTERGEHAIRGMVARGILVDVTHMSEAAMDATFALLDQIDPSKQVPVFASHTACSFGGYAYNIRKDHVMKIKERGGVCGILYCDHFMRDGKGLETRTLEQSPEVIDRQLKQPREWGGDDILAIGSDLDGFIKPTLAGLSSAANHADVAAHLHKTYGAELADKICHGNALRLFERGWMRPFR